MKNIIRLTESDLTRIVKRVIEEQGTDCPPRKVTKSVIDSILPSFKIDLKSEIEFMKNNLLKEISADTVVKKKLIGFFNSVVTENFNILYNIGVRSNYARFGITGYYDQTTDVQTLVNNITNKIISTLESNFIYDNALKVYITKGNINKVKEMSADVLEMAFRELNRLLLKSDLGLKSDISDKMRCKNGKFNLIMNPDGVQEYRVLEYYDSKKSELFNKLNDYV